MKVNREMQEGDGWPNLRHRSAFFWLRCACNNLHPQKAKMMKACGQKPLNLQASEGSSATKNHR